MLLSSLCFAIMSAIAKEMSHTFSSIQLVFFRSAVGLPFLLTSLYRKPAVQTGGKLYFIILRGLLGAFTLYPLLYPGTPWFVLNKYLWPGIPAFHRGF